MDPLGNALADSSDLILQHFNAKDVIRYSLVSMSWHEIIGSSRRCMRKIWLRIDRPTAQLSLLGRSPRKYENFRFQPGCRAELAKLLKRFRPKIAMITDDETNHDDYFKFMLTLAPTIEQLHPGDAATVNALKLKTIDFPMLKELQYTISNRSAFSIFLGSNPRLEKVLFSFSNEVPSDLLLPTNIVHEFFQRNPQIKSLWICEIDCAFQSDITKNVHFKLKTFAFGKTNSRFNEKVRENFVKFVRSQNELEWLKILCLHDREVFTRIWSGGSFKKLFIMDCSLKGALHNHELQMNRSIDEINFYLNPSCHILKFLRASPNLKAFKIRQLSKQIMEFAALNLPRLELIQYQSVENIVEGVYDDLKASDDKDINRKIQLKEMDFFEYVGRDAGF